MIFKIIQGWTKNKTTMGICRVLQELETRQEQVDMDKVVGDQEKVRGEYFTFALSGCHGELQRFTGNSFSNYSVEVANLKSMMPILIIGFR